MGKTPVVLSLTGFASVLLLAGIVLAGGIDHYLGLTLGVFGLTTVLQLVALVANVVLLRKGATGWKIYAAIYSLLILVFLGTITTVIINLIRPQHYN